MKYTIAAILIVGAVVTASNTGALRGTGQGALSLAAGWNPFAITRPAPAPAATMPAVKTPCPATDSSGKGVSLTPPGTAACPYVKPVVAAPVSAPKPATPASSFPARPVSSGTPSGDSTGGGSANSNVVSLTINQIVALKGMTAGDKGSGTVSPAVGGTYTRNTTAVITAKPDVGSSVVWQGACSGSGNTCKVKMDSNKQVSYSFIKTKSFGEKCKPISKDEQIKRVLEDKSLTAEQRRSRLENLKDSLLSCAWEF